MTITTEQVYLLNNKFGALAHKVQLGTLIQNAESVSASEIALAEGKVLVGDASGLATATTMTSGQLLIGSAASKAVAVAMSGDATIAASGALTIAALAVSAAKLAADAVTTVKILDANVTLAKLAAGITPSHVVKYAGKFTTLGGDATEVITVAGVASTDVVQVTVQTTGTGTRSIVDAVPTTNTITVTLSGDPSNNHILAYSVLRAAA